LEYGKCLYHFLFDPSCNPHIACISHYLHSLFKDVPSCLYFWVSHSLFQGYIKKKADMSIHSF
jgi:hypothetical protein